MKLWKKAALSLTICIAAALSACAPDVKYGVPPLNEADEQRKTCSTYPDFDGVLKALPDHEWLRTSSGETVVTPDGRRWVSFDVVQRREARLIKFAGVDAKGAHFECFDDLAWLSKTYTDLEP